MAFRRARAEAFIGLLAMVLLGLSAPPANAGKPYAWRGPTDCHGGRATPAVAEDAEVLAQLNFARTRPADYARYLTGFRAYYDGHVVYEPGRPAISTNEGVAALDEAIDFMRRQAPLPPLAEDGALVRSATRFAAEAGPAGIVGHFGGRGSSPAERIPAACLGAGMIAEVISYGQSDAAGVVRHLIIDDGLPSRSHRRDLFSPALTAAGAGCGPHRVYGTMCVIDLAALGARR
ncbi:MAG: CAP domain-containing protein [Caulobacteraceae bacterium]